jgi:galactokinase
VAAAKTGAARDRYNRAADLVAELVAIGRGIRPESQIGRAAEFRGRTLADVVDASPNAEADLRALVQQARSRFTAAELLRRLDHFLEEDRRILPAALEALGSGRWDAFGALVDQSQWAAERLLGNQVAETITLQRLARERGALAASAFGAGFGGSVWALVPVSAASDFQVGWLESLRLRHPSTTERASAFVSNPASAAAEFLS